MTVRVYLFIIWCLLVVGVAIVTSYYAWSPFADGRRSGSSGFYGPTHK